YAGTEIRSKLIGSYNAANLAAAIAIGTYFEVAEQDIRDAIEGYSPTNNRSQLLAIGDKKLILDAYNANPSSMAAAIANFIESTVAPRSMILGDMFELGAESLGEHQ